MCLAVSNGPGNTDGVGRVAVVPTTHQAALNGLAKMASDIGASKLVLGLKRRNYSSKATPTLMATVMGKLVKASNKYLVLSD